MADDEDLATAFDEGVDLTKGFEGDTLGGWEDEDLMGAEANRVDGVGVDEVDVVAGGEYGGHKRGDDEVGHFFGDGDFARRELRPGVIGGEEQGNLIGRLALA